MALGACSAQGAPAAKGSSFRADAARVLARDEAFIGGPVAVPAGKSFNLVLDNRDGEPHNVTILGGATGSAARFVGEVFSGPEARMYTVQALEAGSDPVPFDVHPGMTRAIVPGWPPARTPAPDSCFSIR